MTQSNRRRGAVLLLAALLLLPPGAAAAERPSAAAAETAGAPPPAATEHSIVLGGRPFAFKATASAIPVKDAQSGETIAEVATLAFSREPASCRPVVFAFNGGPGAGSAWLNLGAVGPWRLPLAGAVPSTPARLVDNQESWIAFADLVFIDPPGTGFSRLPANESARKHVLSVEGDIDMLAAVIRRWSERERREACPKYLLGESYGGFRAPKIARALQERKNVGVDGLILVSPVLDFAWIDDRDNPLADAGRLPSLVASRTGAKSRDALAEAENFARGDYIADVLRGPSDAAALARLVARLAALTGLPAETLRRLGGRVGASDWARDSDPSGRTVASAYDGGARGLNPDPARFSDWADPVLDAWRAPLSQAMALMIAEKLKWPVGDASYEILNDRVAHGWDWGRGRKGQEALSDLRRAMALDPRVKILVAHGLGDLVTPYFATRLLLDQSAAVGPPERIAFLALPGGHMFYADDFSRAALRDAARMLIVGD